MGGGLEVGLSHGAVAAMWRPLGDRWRPVLQVADVRHVPDGSGLRPAPEQRYRLDLSDGVHLQPGTLAASLNHLVVRDAALRRGSVVRVLDFVCDYNRRTINILQLQILQTECALIGSLKVYEPTRKSEGFTTGSMRNALRPDREPYFGDQHIHQSCIASNAVGSANGLSYHGPCGGPTLPGGDMLCSAALLAEPAVWKMVRQIKDENLGYLYEPDFITVKAAISFIKTERLPTAACPLVVRGKPCNFKATGNVHSGQRYEQSFGSCDYGTLHRKRYEHGFDSCDYGYSVRIQIQDHTGATFATACDEAAKEIFGFTAKELYLMEYEKQDYEQLDDIILGIACKQYVLRLKIKAKLLSDGGRVECVLLKAEKVNASAESRRLLRVIDTHLGEGLGSCWEFDNSMPTYSGLPDFKGRSAMQSSSGSHTASPGRARWLGSVDRFGQQVNGCATVPVAFSAFGACGCGDHSSDTDGLRSPPDFFVGTDGLRSSSPDFFVDTDGLRSSSPDFFVDTFYGASPAVNTAPDVPSRCSTRPSAHGAERSQRKPRLPGALSRR